MARFVDIQGVNDLGCAEFVEAFGNIVECCPETATVIWCKRPFADIDAIVDAANCYLDYLPVDAKERILRLHPDLAGRWADEGKLTEESAREQKFAELDKLSPSDKEEINKMNTSYRKRFGFPFVICARENKISAIMSGLKERLGNLKDKELETGIQEVKKICRLRILEMFDNDINIKEIV